MEPPRPHPFANRPEYLELLTRLREELELGNHYLAGMAFLILEIDDTLPPRDEAVMKERLLKRAFTATQRSIRLERGIKRKVADFVLRIDHYLFVSLGSVDSGSLRVPLCRMTNQIRNEFYSMGDIQALRIHRNLSIGISHWMPNAGFIDETVMFERAWNALEEAKTGLGHPDPYSYLGLSPSTMDTLQLKIISPEKAPAPSAKPQPAAKSIPATRPAVVARKAQDAKPEKKGWQFWK